jgi:hypothetical protein
MDGDKMLFSCETLELPWKDNQPDVSCIPVGNYTGIKVDATIRIPYQHISIPNVHMRSGICIHKANYASELRGCIAVGAYPLDMNKDGQLDVTNSSDTFNKLMKILPTVFEVVIK